VPVEQRAAAPHGGERLPALGVVDDADQRSVGVLRRDRHAPLRDPVEEVHGAVERVDDPAQARRATAVATGVLLAEDPVVRACVEQRLDDGALRRTVGLADGIGRRGLGADLEVVGAGGAPTLVVEQYAAGARRRRHREVQQRAGLDGAHPKNTSATR
jgi:hypothetical protein